MTQVKQSQDKDHRHTDHRKKLNLKLWDSLIIKLYRVKLRNVFTSSSLDGQFNLKSSQVHWFFQNLVESACFVMAIARN